MSQPLAAGRHRRQRKLSRGRALTVVLCLGLLTAETIAFAAQSRSPDPDSQQAIDDAAARVEVSEYVAAINVVEAAIEAIEQRTNRYDLDLVRPLVVLGDALAGVGDTEGAFGAYDRALHIARVNLGLHHPSQVPIVYREARLLAKLDNWKAANSRHEYAYTILLRSYGGDSPELLPGLFALADWYMSNYNIFSARALYEHASNVATRHLPTDHPARIRALRSVAATYRNERFPPFYTRRRDEQGSTSGSYAGFQYRPTNNPSVNSFAKGERALIEVINIVQERDGGIGEDVARAMLELADWFIMFEKHSRATSLYRRVWELLQSKPDLRNTTFASPTPLYLALPSDPTKPDRADEDEAQEGVIEMSVDIDPRGFVSHIDTLRSEPKDLMDFKVRRALKRARYRPAFDGLKPLATEDVRIKHSFVYYRSAHVSDAGAETSVADRGQTRSNADW